MNVVCLWKWGGMQGCSIRMIDMLETRSHRDLYFVKYNVICLSYGDKCCMFMEVGRNAGVFYKNDRQT